jgi:hypothetical protein
VEWGADLDTARRRLPQHGSHVSQGQLFRRDVVTKVFRLMRPLGQYFDQLGPSPWIPFEK